MSRRATLDPFSWDVPDDERPIPLPDESSLVAVDDPDASSGAGAVTTSSGLSEAPREAPSVVPEVGWSARFTATVLLSCCLAFGVGWTWHSGDLPPAPERRNDVSSTNGNAAPQEGASR